MCSQTPKSVLFSLSALLGSLCCAATLITPLQAAPAGAGAVVLVNSTSSKFLDFRHYLQPYLDNFGVPYAVLDISTNAIGTNLERYALIIIGHSGLDSNHVFLDSAAQSGLSAAVASGTGLVNFDSDLSAAGGVPRYQFIQDIFGFGYGAGSLGGNVSFPATEPSRRCTTSQHGIKPTIP